METSQWSQVIERLEKLERQNRRMKQAGIAGLLFISCVLLMGQAPSTKAVEANEFILRDTSGKTLGRWTIEKGLPKMEMYDVTKRQQTTFGIASALVGLGGRGATVPQPVLRMEEGDTSTVLLVGTGGSNLIFNTSGDNASSVMLGMSLFGPQLFLGRNGKSNATLSITGSGPSLEITDEAGFQTTIGNAELETARTGESHKTSAASVILFDKDKKVLWKAP